MKKLKAVVAILLAALMVMNAASMGVAQAKMVTTEEVIEQTGPDDGRARVIQFLDREDVRQQLIELGVDPAKAMQRVDALSDKEVQLIVGQLDQLPAGSNDPFMGPYIYLALAAAVVFALLVATVFYFIIESTSGD